MSEVPDAGTGLFVRQVYGFPGQIYRCPKHSGDDCSLCGGSGYREVCNKTACHEYGCSFHNCTSTKKDFDLQELRIERNKQRGAA